MFVLFGVVGAFLRPGVVSCVIYFYVLANLGTSCDTGNI